MDKYAQVRAIPLSQLITILVPGGVFKKRPSKQEWFGLCPIHNSKNNKTAFSFTDVKFHCFSCGAKGSGAIDLTRQIKQCGFNDAVEWLQKLSPLPAVQGDAPRTDKGENKPFNGNYEKYYQECEWLSKRGFTQDTLDKFGVGLYNNPARKSLYTGKVMLPILRFSDGAKVGYLSRDISGEDGVPKYRFPEGFLKHVELFGAWQIKSHANEKGLVLPLRVGFVVESPFCVMKYWQQGIFSVSLFGAFPSVEQAKMIQSLFRGIVYLPDRNKYAEVLAKPNPFHQIWSKVPNLPEGIDDPEHLSVEQIQSLL